MAHIRRNKHLSKHNIFLREYVPVINTSRPSDGLSRALWSPEDVTTPGTELRAMQLLYQSSPVNVFHWSYNSVQCIVWLRGNIVGLRLYFMHLHGRRTPELYFGTQELPGGVADVVSIGRYRVQYQAQSYPENRQSYFLPCLAVSIRWTNQAPVDHTDGRNDVTECHLFG